MKGNEKVLETLNGLLREELTAISQYMVHAEMYEDWGYSKLGEAEEHSAIQEMKHAEKLISRILFLEGRPIVSELNPIHIGKAVDEMLKNDLALETDAVKLYNDAIKLVIAEKDNGTKECRASTAPLIEFDGCASRAHGSCGGALVLLFRLFRVLTLILSSASLFSTAPAALFIQELKKRCSAP